MLRLRTKILGIDVAATQFEVRGFASCAPEVRAHLEGHAAAFVEGYNTALVQDDATLLGAQLRHRVVPERCGFAFEGAAMACMLLDTLPVPGRGRFARLLAGSGAHEPFLLHAGAGWAYARLRRRSWSTAAFDPLLRWLPYDGYGFHQAFFASGGANLVHGPLKWAPYAHRAFHQGVGRALWFSCGADPERIAAMTAIFPSVFATDLWSGVGLAATYAGGVPAGALATLVSEAGAAAPALAQGAIAATAARVTADNANADTELACIELCELSVDKAYALYETALDGLEPHRDPMAYETWRTRVQTYFQEAGR